MAKEYSGYVCIEAHDEDDFNSFVADFLKQTKKK
jgi:hypothetical protein